MSEPLPEAAYRTSDLLDEDEAFLHAQIISRIRLELRPQDVLGEMLAERVASTYISIRAREAASSFDTDRAMREANGIWLEFTKELRKQCEPVDPTESQLRGLAEAVIVATEALPERQRNRMREDLASALEGASSV